MGCQNNYIMIKFEKIPKKNRSQWDTQKEPVPMGQKGTERKEKMQEKYTWNLKDIFKTEDDFEEEIKELNSILEEIKKYKGKLSQSSQNIYECYKNY